MSKPELQAVHLNDWSSLQEEEGDVGDVDYFTLNEDKSCLQVNPRWLQYLQMTRLACQAAASKQARDAGLSSLHGEKNCLQVNPQWQQQIQVRSPSRIYTLLLQERLYDDDGQCRKAKAGRNPHNTGLSLEYVFGSIRSFHEGARDEAQRCLGEQTATLSIKLSVICC